MMKNGGGGAGGMPDMSQFADMMKNGGGGAGGMPDMSQFAEMMKNMKGNGQSSDEPSGPQVDELD